MRYFLLQKRRIISPLSRGKVRVRGMKSQKGFTLIEVVVALAVLVIAMAALIKAAGGNAANQAYLEERTFANWVAANQLNNAHLGITAATQGVSEGNEVLAGREWHWRLELSATSDQQVLRADVEVAADPASDDISAQLTGYVGVDQ